MMKSRRNCFQLIPAREYGEFSKSGLLFDSKSCINWARLVSCSEGVILPGFRSFKQTVFSSLIVLLLLLLLGFFIRKIDHAFILVSLRVPVCQRSTIVKDINMLRLQLTQHHYAQMLMDCKTISFQ